MWVVVTIGGAVMASVLLYRRWTAHGKVKQPSNGKVAIVTGANSGLGLATSKLLCLAGYDVILACRSGSRAQIALDEIRKDCPDAQATYMHLDLANKTSIKQFVEDFQSTGKPLDLLINNAGLHSENRKTTADGFELTMGTNHLGHFYLTHLLLSNLKQRSRDVGESRIVVIASHTHHPEVKKKMKQKVAPLNFDNLMFEIEGSYNGMEAYTNSKLANILFTYKLSRDLEGSGVTVNCLCPGFIPATGLIQAAPLKTKIVTRYVLAGLFRFLNVTRTVEDGSSRITDLAMSTDFKGITGKYFRDGKEDQSSDESYDEETQQKLWDISLKLLNISDTDS